MIQNIAASSGSIPYLEVVPTSSLLQRTTDVALSRIVSKAPTWSFRQYFVSAVVIAVLAFVVSRLVKMIQDDEHFPFRAPAVNPPLLPAHPVVNRGVLPAHPVVNPPPPPPVIEDGEFESLSDFERPVIDPLTSVFFTVPNPTPDDFLNFGCHLTRWIQDPSVCLALLKLIKNDNHGLVLAAYLGYEQGQEKTQAENLYRALYKSVNGDDVEPPRQVRFQRLMDDDLEVDRPYWTAEDVQGFLQNIAEEESMDHAPAAGDGRMSEEDEIAFAIRESEQLAETTRAQEEALVNGQLAAALKESEESLKDEQKLVVPETRELVPFMEVCFAAFQRTQLYQDALEKTEAVNMPLFRRLVDPVVSAFMDYLVSQNVPQLVLVHKGAKKRLNPLGTVEVIEIYFRSTDRGMIGQK